MGVMLIERRKLKELRKSKKMTQEEIANELGISRPMYTNIENGRRNPSLKVMKKIVDFLGEDAKNIFFDSGVA